MEKKFNIGDRVMCTDNGKLGVVTEVDIDGYGCVVLFDDGEDTWIESDMLGHSNEPPYDQKTAFLTEFKDLMNKHGVRFGIDLENKDASFSFNDGEVSVFSEEFFKIITDIKSKY